MLPVYGRQMTLTATGTFETGQHLTEKVLVQGSNGLCIRKGQTATRRQHDIGLTSRNRNDPLAMHEFQNAVDRIFKRRIRFAPRRGIPSRLIRRTVIAFELHR